MPTWSRYRAERISSALFGPLKGSARTLRSWRSRTERGAASTRPRTPWSEWTCTPSHDPNGERARPGAAGDPGQRARRLAPAAQRCRPLRRRARPAPPPRPPGPGDAPGRPCRPRRRHSRGAGRRARAGLRPGPARPGPARSSRRRCSGRPPATPRETSRPACGWSPSTAAGSSPSAGAARTASAPPPASGSSARSSRTRCCYASRLMLRPAATACSPACATRTPTPAPRSAWPRSASSRSAECQPAAMSTGRSGNSPPRGR